MGASFPFFSEIDLYKLSQVVIMSVNVMKERRPVRDGYLVKVGVLAVEEECVRAPDLVQELPVHGQLADERRAVVNLHQLEASIEYCHQSTNHSSPASRPASSAGSSSPVCTAPGTHL